jgi:hypothetical protein
MASIFLARVRSAKLMAATLRQRQVLQLADRALDAFTGEGPQTRCSAADE